MMSISDGAERPCGTARPVDMRSRSQQLGHPARVIRITRAPADVFASAAPANMKTVTDAGEATGTPQIFTRNTAEIMVESGNPLWASVDPTAITVYPP